MQFNFSVKTLQTLNTTLEAGSNALRAYLKAFVTFSDERVERTGKRNGCALNAQKSTFL